MWRKKWLDRLIVPSARNARWNFSDDLHLHEKEINIRLTLVTLSKAINDEKEQDAENLVEHPTTEKGSVFPSTLDRPRYAATSMTSAEIQHA